MLLDIILAILLVFAVIKGLRRGLIVAIFSFIAIIVGLAAAMKLSAVTAKYIGSAVSVSDRWLPIVSFIVVFVIVLLLIRWGAKLVENVAESVSLGWLNRTGGILLYAIIYITVFSVILFYLEQIRFIRPETMKESLSYPMIRSWGPKAIEAIGVVLPFFRNMFTDLEQFFDGVSKNVPVQ